MRNVLTAAFHENCFPESLPGNLMEFTIKSLDSCSRKNRDYPSHDVLQIWNKAVNFLGVYLP